MIKDIYQKIHPRTGTNKDREPKKYLQWQKLHKMLFWWKFREKRGSEKDKTHPW